MNAALASPSAFEQARRFGSAASRGVKGVSLDDLLKPSLSSPRDVRSLYSVRANYLVAFVGGVYASIGMGVANSLRAQRLQRDWPVYLAAFVGWTAFVLWYSRATALGTPPAWAGVLGAHHRTLNIIGRALGLALFGIVYLRHQALFRAAEALGVGAPSPWKVGLVVCGLALVVSLVVAAIGASLGS